MGRPREARASGGRGDWRLLLPERPSSVALLGLGDEADWRWLVDDGWVAEVVVELPEPPAPVSRPASTGAPVSLPDSTGTPGLDAVIVGSDVGLDRPGGIDGLIGRAFDAIEPGGTVVVLGGRTRAAIRTLRRRGAETIRRYLAVPDAEAPDRLVPIDHPGGLAWLAGPKPALAAASLPLHRRLARRALRHLGPLMPRPFGQVVVVATAPGGPGHPVEPGPLAARLLDGSGGAGASDAIVITSGFDEGSRTVVLPLDSDGRPLAVVKVVARPAYRAGAEREHELLGRLADRVEPAGLVPRPLASIERDGLVAVAEGYAGRWTASAVLNEQRAIDRRVAVLDAVMGSITALARTGIGTETWNEDGFEALIGRWFDRLDADEGRSPRRQVLRADLLERSRLLEGRALPFGLRHYDLGPWNVVLADAPRRADRRAQGPAATGSPITFVDWERTETRNGSTGPVGADHLYIAKYWLHIVEGCRSVDDEVEAFAFLGRRPGRAEVVERVLAEEAVVAAARDLGLPVGFLPLIEAHVWSEAACHLAARHRAGAEGPSSSGPARYLDALARHRSILLTRWPIDATAGSAI